jgi:hypothetical protein
VDPRCPIGRGSGHHCYHRRIAGAEPPLPEPSAERTAPLRGAGVDVDARRAGQVVVVVCLAALAITSVVLFVAGANKNAQETSLVRHGITVPVTITRCLWELGGSGSNLAGYACTGTYAVDGRSYAESVPGSSLHAAGSTITGVTVRSDPTLLSTASIVRAQHPSWKVFVVPTILLVVLLGLVGLILVRGRRRSSSP